MPESMQERSDNELEKLLFSDRVDNQEMHQMTEWASQKQLFRMINYTYNSKNIIFISFYIWDSIIQEHAELKKVSVTSKSTARTAIFFLQRRDCVVSSPRYEVLILM